MLRAHHRLFDRGIKALDLLFVGGAVWVGTLWQPGVESIAVLQQASVLCLAWLAVTMRTNFYQSRRTSRLAGEFFDLLESWFVAVALGSFVLMSFFGGLKFDPLVTFAGAYCSIATVRLVLRLTLRQLRGSGHNFRKVVLVGRGRVAHHIAESISHRPEYGLRIGGSFHLNGETGVAPDGVEDLGDATRFAKAITDMEVDSVVLCPDMRVNQADIQHILDKCDVAGIHCFYAPDFLHLSNLNATSTDFGGLPAFTFQPRLGSPVQLAVKRGMDILGAVVGIALTAPALIGISLAIKLFDRGPLLFKQVRVGKDGRRFYCYKFRSMCVDAEAKKAELAEQNEQDGPVFKMENDPRITPVGRFIRKYSLDELPQLFNVLFGDMSLVGPRPPVPSEVARYSWWQRRRISVRPGITCVWQVKGRNRVSFEKWMEMDLFYIDNWSLWMDVKLMMQTMPAVVRGTGS